MKRKVKNIIFYSEGVDLRAGGPSGYIANLMTGLEEIGSNDVEVVFRKEEPTLKYVPLIRILTSVIPFRSIRRKVRNYFIELANKSSVDAISLDAFRYKNFVKILDALEF
ncbi:MAG: hypothetical protein IJZ18_05415, partial [Mailhella sp.]|nr:hypothetical protein [Mailhella sp.]